MNLREIEERVAAVESRPGVEYLSDLLLAYGLPRTSVSRLMSGTYDKAETADERLWKDKVYFRYADGSDEALYEYIDAARADERVVKHRPRFLIVKNDHRLLAGDQKTGATLDIEVGELASNATFFGAWAGFEKTQLENLNVADRKAAEKMAKLYDEVIRHNSIETEDAMHDLNVFFSRLLFCFFAEDTGVFDEGSFTNALGSYTRESGADTHAFLDQLVEVLDTDPAERDGLPAHLRTFGYVNGNLFERRSPAPRFSAKARAVILECGTLDWSQINPDIFGSMIQAVVHPSQRGGLGMHYTSVENIMKVIRPLFLDDLEGAFEAAGTVKKLDALLERITAAACPMTHPLAIRSQTSSILIASTPASSSRCRWRAMTSKSRSATVSPRDTTTARTSHIEFGSSPPTSSRRSTASTPTHKRRTSRSCLLACRPTRRRAPSPSSTGLTRSSSRTLTPRAATSARRASSRTGRHRRPATTVNRRPRGERPRRPATSRVRSTLRPMLIDTTLTQKHGWKPTNQVICPGFGGVGILESGGVVGG